MQLMGPTIVGLTRGEDVKGLVEVEGDRLGPLRWLDEVERGRRLKLDLTEVSGFLTGSEGFGFIFLKGDWLGSAGMRCCSI